MPNIFSHYNGFYLQNTQISQSSILISPGEIVPFESGWDLSLGYKNRVQKLIPIEQNNSLFGRIDTIIAKPDICNISGGFASVDILVLKGIPAINPLPNNSIDSPGIFLGWVYVDGQFPIKPSILCCRSFNQAIDNTLKVEHPSSVLKTILSTVEEWQPNTLYFYGQLVKSNNSIFISLVSHGSSSSILSDLQNSKWQEITGDENDIQSLIQQVLIRLLPDYIKHPSQPEFSIQFNVQNEFQGSQKLKWNQQFNQIEVDGGLNLKSQISTMQVPTDGINIYTKKINNLSTKHIEGFLVDESGTERTIFTLNLPQ